MVDEATEPVEEEVKPAIDDYTDDQLEDLDRALYADAPVVEDEADEQAQPSRPEEGTSEDAAWLLSLPEDEWNEEFARRQRAARDSINAELSALGRTPLEDDDEDDSDTTGLLPSEHAAAYGPEPTDAEIDARLTAEDMANDQLSRKMRIDRAKEHIASLRAKAEAKLRPDPEDLTPAEAERALYSDTMFNAMSDDEFRAFLKARDAGAPGITKGIGADALDQTYRKFAPAKKVGER